MTQPAFAVHTLTNTPTPLDELPASWRARATELRRWAAADGAASALERAAEELEQRLAQEAGQLLNVAQAAALTGRHRDTIGGAISAGRLTNHGRKGGPRVRRGELLRVFPLSEVAGDEYDPVADARSILGTRRGGR
jgi:hypothetical protein